MKTGMNLLLWSTHVTAELFPVLGELKSLGYDGVELPLFEGDAAHYRTVRAELDRQGLEATAVTVLSEDANPISPNPAVRQAAVDRMKWAIEMSQICGVKYLCGPFHSPLAVFSGTGPTETEKQYAADTLRKVSEFAATADVTLTIEYLNRFECYFLTTAADARKLVKAVDHPNFRTMYDSFHANIEEKDVAEAIRHLSDVMAHVHISENDRGTPGTGHVEWVKTFRTLKDVGYDGWLVIEAFGRALPALAAATKVWRDLFPAPQEVYQEGLAFMKRMWAEA
ncbi:sugar phosphate isomerase/epimerase family protein [Tuwongella immobilis]|uniref:Xylose isomerase-like TIM barrel domain-containing protein n=1 Tax=Tuwongella immobilis TaxID=692036 RepID=A0A6C2YLF2_9BACT|nr:sugar phosphate isomerase/epimerase family protein [Tuwongella immobilis]VIP02197.1 Xylose isomerase domain-containing protein TIM barrel OS=Planctomyces brasiliensis (strain ATCC 49424 / DSM 5305 / JCM 21570 / NBRC 103401 / IFAM 1448) GN=Plabr_0077 PE=4 SV=1: AP_endonuc_2 [Tuwongella immobilis]VTS00678.1 Xylose isomerase domain-containing protein TIM barrel OS=Planctomyces brasiliensis (strain ATCC 49424 / DSM 5305 / JCM 21570 / NBRC 103401 / IFAM 1448) GN=Plabr_0077 PE=4 SV=1: AP_endonuc_2 [